MTARIAIVDDDADVRDSLCTLLDLHGFDCVMFDSGDAFLEAGQTGADCVLMDIRMPGRDGIETLAEYSKLPARRPVIIMSGHADVPIAVEAMRVGALNFIEKPFHAKSLLSAIGEALKVARQLQDNSQIEALSPREREVAVLICEGRLNKQIAHTLGISIRTVETHRANLMKKLDVRSVPALVLLMQGRG